MRKWIIIAVIALGIGGGITYAVRRELAPSPLDTFAACLKEKGATLYGTYWCPSCAQQKELFGTSFKRVKYIECAMPGNPRSQAPVCREAGVTGYPTWIFADGSRATGTQELSALAEKTGCELPKTTP